MNAQADLDVMRSIILVAGFRGTQFDSVCAALVMIGLRGGDFTAASLPRDLTQGDIHISGLAVKALLKMGLVEKVGYAPSPNPDAKGRPVCLLRIVSIEKARTYLKSKGYDSPSSACQLSLAG